MKKYIALFLVCFLLSFCRSYAQGYNIELSIKNFDSKSVMLAYYLGDKQYIVDTAYVNTKGSFVFKADTLLPCGMYVFAFELAEEDGSSSMASVLFLVPASDQTFKISMEHYTSTGDAKAEGSVDNQLYIDYMGFISTCRFAGDSMAKLLKADPSLKPLYDADAKRLDSLVRDYQTRLIANNPGSLCASIIKATMQPQIPEFKGTPDEVENARFYWYRAHYFDNINLADPCLMRTDILYNKATYYMTKLVTTNVDSMNTALDYIFSKAKGAPKNYQYLLSHYLNLFAKSQIIGQDACYVHIAKNYYCNGKATWMDKENLDKICENSAKLEPFLIGKTAPDITLQNSAGKAERMYEVDADYTVLFFWKVGCYGCKQASSALVQFADEYKAKGVKVVAICTDAQGNEETWKNEAAQMGFNDYSVLNRSAGENGNSVKLQYDVIKSPKIIILNRNHQIAFKQIEASQLKQAVDGLLKKKQ